MVETADDGRQVQQERAEETRRLLLSATVECLTQYGYAGTTTTQVQRAAGVSRGALLYHFPSKTTLLVAAVRHLVDLTDQQIRAKAMAQPPRGDRIAWALALLWETFSGPLFYVALELWNAARTDEGFWAVLVEEERKLGRDIRNLCREAFGRRVASRPGFDQALDTTLQLMRGAAMTEIMRRNPEAARAQLGVFQRIFVLLLDEPAEPGRRAMSFFVTDAEG